MELNARQWKLYELLKQYHYRWLTQYEIHQMMKGEYPDYIEGEHFHDSNARHFIGLDISRLNQSDVIQKIILSTSQGIKIANAEEYRKYSESKWRSIKRMISRLAWKDHKSRLDGQMKLVFGESMARDYYESFIKSYKEEK